MYKKTMRIFDAWEKRVIGYQRYKIRFIRSMGKVEGICIDVYTKAGKYIKLKKCVKNEEELVDVIVGIVHLFEGKESSDLFREKITCVD